MVTSASSAYDYVIKLRDYQESLVKGIRLSISAGHRVIICVAPTGAGKTTIFSKITQGAAEKKNKVLLLSHRQELVSQSADTLSRFGITHEIIAPASIRAAIASALVKKFGRPMVDRLSTVRTASVQTLAARLTADLKKAANDAEFESKEKPPTWVPDVLIVDEGHHATEGSSWGKVIEYYQRWNPKLLVLLFTATPVRLDGRGLGKGHGGYATDMVIGPSIGWLIERGFLCKTVVYAPSKTLDLSNVKKKFGDYAKGDLEKAIDKPTITGDAVKHYAKICPREPAVAFCASIAHAEHVAEEFRSKGFRAISVNGKTPDDVRRKALEDLANGSIHVLCSADLIGEGVDVPAVKVAILLRPTQSLSLYIQQVGRVLRPAPGKEFAIILDHVGNTSVHGFIDDDRNELWTLEGLVKKKGKAGQNQVAPSIQNCPKCGALHKPALACPVCQHVYKVKIRNMETIDEELVFIDEADAERIREARRREQKREVGKAQTLEDLQRIEKERGYKPGWAKHIWKARQGRQRSVA